MTLVDHYKLSVLCDRAYDDNQSNIWSALETDALVREKDDVIQIAFRGTEFSESLFAGNLSLSGFTNTFDIIKDLRFFPRRSLLGWSHAGFVSGAERWCRKFEKPLSRLGRKLQLTGHSLGAGVAVQAVPELIALGFTIDSVVVFGEPAGFYFGSEKTYQRLGIETVSYLNGADAIKLTPPFGETAVKRENINKKRGVSLDDHYIPSYSDSLKKLICGHV